MIDPPYFGCSSKLSFDETLRLSSNVFRGDYSILPGNPAICLSIDRINRCSRDWRTFADIALNHAVGDVEVGNAIPVQILIAFEFGPDADTEEDRAAASLAFQNAADLRGITIGKRHSTIGYGPTAATIAVLGKRPPSHELLALPPTGAVFLSRPLGFFMMHYMFEMGTSTDERYTSELRLPRSKGAITQNCLRVTDVSGHGLAGALADLASRDNLDISVELDLPRIAAAEVAHLPIGCLINPPEEYPPSIVFHSSVAAELGGLRETYGPLLALGYEDSRLPPLCDVGTIRIGSFRAGQGKVDIGWRE